MRSLTLLLAASVMTGCTSPLPAVNPQMAWVEFSTPFPNDKLLMAERLDNQRLSDGRYFQVTPGSHELIVRFDFEVPGGGGMGTMNSPRERLCYLTINYDHFEAGQRYVLKDARFRSPRVLVCTTPNGKSWQKIGRPTASYNFDQSSFL